MSVTVGDESHAFVYIICNKQVYLIHHYEGKTYYRAFSWKEFARLEEELRNNPDTRTAFFNLFGVRGIFNHYEYEGSAITYWPDLPSTKQMQIYLKEVVRPYSKRYSLRISFTAIKAAFAAL